MKEPDYYRYFNETERRIIKVMNIEDVIDDLIAYYEQSGSSDKLYMWIHQAYWKIFISHEKFNKAIRKENIDDSERKN
jgi:hypothetical protein